MLFGGKFFNNKQMIIPLAEEVSLYFFFFFNKIIPLPFVFANWFDLSKYGHKMKKKMYA